MTRREALLLLGSAIPLGAQQKQGKPKKSPVCVSSKALPGIWYAEMGEIVKQIGFDGIDITVMPGGLVEPSQAPVDEVRALESIHGAGLEAPIITTALASPYEPWSRTVLALAGRTGVGLFRCPVAARRDALGLFAEGREYSIAMTVNAGARDVLRGLDPEWSGVSLDAYCFHPKSGFSETDLQETMPLVRAVTIADFVDDRKPVALGKGEVDFPRMFRLLAQARFTGPLTVFREYKTSDQPGALAKDLEFVRKSISQVAVVAS